MKQKTNQIITINYSSSFYRQSYYNGPLQQEQQQLTLVSFYQMRSTRNINDRVENDSALAKLCIGEGFCFNVKQETHRIVLLLSTAAHCLNKEGSGVAPGLNCAKFNPLLQFSRVKTRNICPSTVQTGMCWVLPPAVYGVIKAAGSALLSFVLVRWSALNLPRPEKAPHLFLLAQLFAVLQEGEGFNQTW